MLSPLFITTFLGTKSLCTANTTGVGNCTPSLPGSSVYIKCLRLLYLGDLYSSDLLIVFIFLGGIRDWSHALPLLGMCSTTWAMPPALLSFGYFGDMVSFSVWAGLHHDLLMLASCVAGMTDIHYHWLRWGLVNFLPRLTHKVILWFSTCQGASITGLKHHAQSYSLFYVHWFRIMSLILCFVLIIEFIFICFSLSRLSTRNIFSQLLCPSDPCHNLFLRMCN
jgi:hypothetical protein